MTTRKYGGTGLGLAITNDLVQLMGGNLTLESQPDEGSVFEFTIPLIAGAAIEDAGEVMRLDGVRLLIIDDHPVNCDILKTQVSQWGVIADCTNTTASALLKLRQATKQNQPFQHVLLDWHMPEMNGLELAQIINQDNNIAKVKMALFSSASFDLNSNELNKNGIACFLHKPIKRHDLYGCLLKLSKLHAESVDENVISTDSAHMRKEFHILLAEDNAVNQEVAEGYLELYGCSVDIAENGQQAIAAAQKKSYDLIFMDCNMPVLDGYEASTLLRKNESIKNHSAVPIVALTADISQGIKDRCLQAGMNDYLSKPFTQQQLQTMLEKWLNTSSLSNPEDNHPKDMMQIDEQRIEQLKKLSERSSRDVLGNAISHYKKIAPNYLGLMQKALEDKDLQLIRDYSHSLKSTSGALGLMDIANRCQSVEDNAKDSQIASLREDINSINRLIPEALAFLDEV